MSFTTSTDVSMYYEQRGAGEPGIVVVHGWRCDHSSMAPLAEELSRRHRVLNVDLRDQGKSQRSLEYSSADVADDLSGLGEQERMDHPVLVGHSQGGKFILACTDRYPEFARAIVIVDSAIGESAAYKAKRLAVVDSGDEERLKARLEGLFIESDEPEVRSELLTRMLKEPYDIARRSLLASDAIDTASTLQHCPVPVLYIASARPFSTQKALLDLNPHLAYVQIADSGHFIPVFAAAQAADAIEQFVAALTT